MIITKKKIEEELLQSEERYKMLFEYMTNGVIILKSRDNGDDYIVEDINQAGQWLDNVKKEDVTGLSILDLQPSIEKNGVFETIRRVWRFGEPAHFPVSIYENGQNFGWREHWIYKLPSGEIVLLYEDIKDWKRIEEKLHKSEYRNRALLESIPDMIFLFSKTAICIDYIPGSEAEPILSAEEIVDNHVQEFMPRDAGNKIVRGIESTIRTDQGRIIEFSLLLDRKIHHYEGRMSAAGRNEVVFIVRDISEEKELYRKLQREEERFRNIVEFLPIGYAEIDVNMVVTYANQPAFNITGFSCSDIDEGLNLKQMLPDFEAAKKNFKLGLEGKRPYPSRYNLRRKDGKIIETLIKSSPISIGGQPLGVRIIIIDISIQA